MIIKIDILMKGLLTTIFVVLSFLLFGQREYTNAQINTINTGLQAAGGDLYWDTDSLDLYVGLMDGRLILVTDDTDTQDILQFEYNAITNEVYIDLERGGRDTINLSALDDNGTDNQNLILGARTGTNQDIDIQRGTGITINVADNDNDPNNEIQDLSLNTTTNILTITDNGTATNIDLTPYLDDTDEQDLSTNPSNNTATTRQVDITNGTSATINIEDNDSDPSNEIQDLSLNTTTNILTITNNGGATSIDLTPYLDDTDTDQQDLSTNPSNNTATTRQVDITNGTSATINIEDNDSDPSNEIQDLSLNTTTNILTITNNGSATSIDLTPYLDDTDTDEQDLSTNPSNNTATTRQIDITNGNSATVNIEDADSDPSNEIQTISKTGDTVTLSDGGGAFDDDHLGASDQTLSADRDINMGGNDLFFAGTRTNVIQADGDMGINTTPNGAFDATNDQNREGFTFTQTNVTTGERDVFTIDDQDSAGGGQDHSSVLKVEKTGTIDAGAIGFSLVELANTGTTDPGPNKYWISGRNTDEGAPEWGVDLDDNDYWSEGGIVLGVTGAGDGSYSGGNFIVEPDGDTGIGNNAPTARLDVSGGNVRFRDYGVGTYMDTLVGTHPHSQHHLGVMANGDVVEVNTVKSAKVFYPPAIVIDVSTVSTGPDETIDLYQEYFTRFTNPAAASPGAPADLPYYNRDELYFYVIDYDTTVFGSTFSVGSDGTASYRVENVPVGNCTYINVAFVVK